MTDISGIDDPSVRRRANRRVAFTGAAILVAAVVGVLLAIQFIEKERERELKQWQVRLGIVADSRFADVERWLEAQIKTLFELSENASLQLYLTISSEAPAASNTDSGAEQAETTFLRNLVTVSADRAGFRPQIARNAVRANVEPTGVAGIALLGKNGDVVVASPGMPSIDGPLRNFVQGAARGKPAVSDMYDGPTGTASMAFIVPIFGVQEDQSAAAQIGSVLGVKEVAAELFPLLKQPGDLSESAETLLVRREGATVIYMSPLADGTQPLKRTLDFDTQDLAAAFAIRRPGGFDKKIDYQGREVLMTSRQLALVPWALLYKVDTAEALAESETRLRQLLFAFALIIGLVIIAMVALWYYGTSRRASEAANRFETLANRFRDQRNFMHLVTDSQPNVIAIFDEDGRYRWFNKVAVELSRLSRKDLFDKTVSSVLGPVEGKKFTGWVRECLESGEPFNVTHTMELEGKGETVYQSNFVKLPPREGAPPGVLMVSEDITESVRERSRRERILRQLVGALVSVVDSRDPYSANHSLRVGIVSRAIAEEMELDSLLCDSVEIAGSLMNLGKIAIPTEILTKMDRLTPEEIETIRTSTLASADMIADIEFDGPVADTLRQLQEHFDGSGLPNGLAGENILLTARIVSVANAFVGMVSARAYRAGMPFDKAVRVLLEAAGSTFDRRAVSALTNYLDNRGGIQVWKSFGEPPEDVAT